MTRGVDSGEKTLHTISGQWMQILMGQQSQEKNIIDNS